MGLDTDPGFDLTGRRALVTGASVGIGAAIATRLAGAGARVVAVSRSGGMPAGGADAGANGGGRSGEVVPLVADLTVSDQLDTVVERAVEELGGLDVLVNNAGRGDWLALAEVDRAYFDDLIGLNLWAPLRLCQLAHPHLAAASSDGSRPGGVGSGDEDRTAVSSGGDAAVVMIGSVDAVRPSAGGVVYGATKAGLAAATVALAKEWAADGVRVTQVDPGIVDTPLAAEVVAELSSEGFGVNLARRAGTGDEIAALVHYLVAPVGRFANGVSFRVDGGAVAMGPFDARR